MTRSTRARPPVPCATRAPAAAAAGTFPRCVSIDRYNVAGHGVGGAGAGVPGARHAHKLRKAASAEAARSGDHTASATTPTTHVLLLKAKPGESGRTDTEAAKTDDVRAVFPHRPLFKRRRHYAPSILPPQPPLLTRTVACIPSIFLVNGWVGLIVLPLSPSLRTQAGCCK